MERKKKAQQVTHKIARIRCFANNALRVMTGAKNSMLNKQQYMQGKFEWSIIHNKRTVIWKKILLDRHNISLNVGEMIRLDSNIFFFFGKISINQKKNIIERQIFLDLFPHFENNLHSSLFWQAD